MEKCASLKYASSFVWERDRSLSFYLVLFSIHTEEALDKSQRFNSCGAGLKQWLRDFSVDNQDGCWCRAVCYISTIIQRYWCLSMIVTFCLIQMCTKAVWSTSDKGSWDVLTTGWYYQMTSKALTSRDYITILSLLPPAQRLHFQSGLSSPGW